MRWNKLLRFILFMAFIFIALPLFAVHANVRDVRPQRPLPTNLSTLQLETPLQIQGAGNIVPFHNNERQSVIVQLQALPIARVVTTSRFSFAEQLNQRSKIYAEQQALIAHAESLDAELRVFGRVRNALNAVMLEIDTAVLPQLAANPDVVSIQPIVDYKIDLTDTAVIEPASITQNQTYDGSGISVAVLDSGIDYTHVDFGGSGNQNDYTNNNPFIVEPGSFPTNKIVGGYDFVGSRWLTSDFGRNSLLHADPDPLDLGIIAGHGTRIASILGGVNGIAPGVDLYAVRVCTSHTTLCSGIALIQGFDYLLDPNRDGYIDDAVDIVNLSIQAKQHSPFDMQVNEALENISRTGILTVGSAGNGFNHPYGTGMPGASTTVLTVGATASASTPYIIDSANRGPLFLNHLIKPELVAPSLVETAVAGSGQARDFNQETVAAVPIVAGNAAILMEAFPDRPWHEVKALLISTGEVDVYDSNTPARQFAPINLIGGGEIRIEQALNADVSIWDNRQPGTAVLSFGFQEVGRSTLALRKQIRVQNYTDAPVQYDLSTSFRFEDDDINGAVSIWTPRTIRVPANGAATFPVLMRINGNALRTWPPLSGQNSLTAVQLTELEYDGYIWLDDVSTTLDDQTPLHLAWHVLPRAVSDVVLELAQNEVILKNEGINQVDVSTYSLIGISSNRLDATNNGDVAAPDLRYVGYSTILVPPGVCSDNSSFLFAFAINLWQPQIVPSASNGLLKIDIDTDQNGVVDYSVVKAGLDQFSPWPDQPLSWVVDWEADSATTQFYVDADMQSKNNILYACAEQIGMDATDYFNPIDLRITVIDKNGGEIEAIEGVTVSPLGEQYMAMFPPNDVGITSISPNSNDAMTVLDFGFLTNNSERGLLLLYGNGLNGPDAIAVELSP